MSGQLIDFGIRLGLLDVVPRGDELEGGRHLQCCQVCLGLVTVRHRRQCQSAAGTPAHFDDFHIVWLTMTAHGFGIGNQLVVDSEPDLDISLPGRLHAELGHAAAGSVLQTKP